MNDMASLLHDRVQNAIVTAVNNKLVQSVEMAVGYNPYRLSRDSERLVNNIQLCGLVCKTPEKPLLAATNEVILTKLLTKMNPSLRTLFGKMIKDSPSMKKTFDMRASIMQDYEASWLKASMRFVLRVLFSVLYTTPSSKNLFQVTF